MKKFFNKQTNKESKKERDFKLNKNKFSRTPSTMV